MGPRPRRRRADPLAIKNEIYSDGTCTHDAYSSSLRTSFSASEVSQARLRIDEEEHGLVPETDASGRTEMVKASRPRKKRVIKANPGAAEVWLAERRKGAPWRERAERVQQVLDEVARKEQALKRTSLLAKQASEGLQRVYGIHVDAAELAPMLTEATKEMQRPRPDPKVARLLKAAERYDLKALARCLDAHTKAAAPQPCLSIATRPHVMPRP